MSTGGAIAIVGVAAVGVGGLFLLKRRSAAAAGVAAASASPTGTLPGASSSSSAPAITQLANGLQALNNAACNTVLGAKGVPAGLGSTGCSLYGRYLSPIGLAQTTVGLVEKIPVVGSAVKTGVSAVAHVASKPISAVTNFIGGLF